MIGLPKGLGVGPVFDTIPFPAVLAMSTSLFVILNLNLSLANLIWFYFIMSESIKWLFIFFSWLLLILPWSISFYKSFIEDFKLSLIIVSS